MERFQWKWRRVGDKPHCSVTWREAALVLSCDFAPSQKCEIPKMTHSCADIEWSCFSQVKTKDHFSFVPHFFSHVYFLPSFLCPLLSGLLLTSACVLVCMCVIVQTIDYAEQLRIMQKTKEKLEIALEKQQDCTYLYSPPKTTSFCPPSSKSPFIFLFLLGSTGCLFFVIPKCIHSFHSASSARLNVPCYLMRCLCVSWYISEHQCRVNIIHIHIVTLYVSYYRFVTSGRVC